jgi:hypothetical protein
MSVHKPDAVIDDAGFDQAGEVGEISLRAFEKRSALRSAAIQNSKALW